MKKFSPKDTPLSLYIHLPWCEKQCPYCDFNIDTNKKDGEEESLIEAILTDLDASKEYILDRKFISVYFGGGTPSLIKSKNIEKIFKVNVTKINIINKQNRVKITRGKKVRVSGFKKAIITLKKGQSIDLTTGI